MLSSFQKQKLSHLFSILDFDHNGLLQKTDLHHIAENIAVFAGVIEAKGHQSILITHAESVWSSICNYFNQPDLDSINLDGWLEFMEAYFYAPDDDTIDQRINHMVDVAHETFDKNRDVLISKLEFMSIFVSFRVEVRFANKCFESIDSNGDEHISKSELLEATREFFRSDDAKSVGNQLFGELGSSHFTSRKSLY